MIKPKAKEIPLFWGHGRADGVVQYKCKPCFFNSLGRRGELADLIVGQQSVELLTKLGYPTVPANKSFAKPGLVFKSYAGMAHSSSQEEIEDLRVWLTEALK